MVDQQPSTLPRTTSLGKRLRRAFVRLGVVLACLYGSVLLALVCLETTLVYPGARHGDWNQQSVQHESVWLTSKDGTRINAWFLDAPETGENESQFALLMSHGNGENISMMLNEADRYRQSHGLAVLIYDYRGFGQSDGSPAEAGVLADGEAALEWLRQRTGLGNDKIFQFGRSLGGGVAVHLASTFGSAGLILDRTFNSVVDVAASRYWMMPIRLVIRNRYPSELKIAKYTAPLLQLHGDKDEVIDIAFARKLFAAAGSGDKTFVESPGTSHIDAWPEVFTTATESFIERIIAAEEVSSNSLQF